MHEHSCVYMRVDWINKFTLQETAVVVSLIARYAM